MNTRSDRTVRPNFRRRSVAALAVIGCVVVTGCGSQLSHGQFVAAANGTTIATTSTGGGVSGDATTGDQGAGTSAAGTAVAGTDPSGAAGVSGSTASAGTGTAPTTAGGGVASTGGVAGTTGGTVAGTNTGTTAGTTPGTTVNGKKSTQPAVAGKTVTKSGGATTTGKGAGSGSSAAPGAAAAVQTGPILIGSVGDYSGVAGDAEAQGPVGLQVWAQALNAAGGINGRQVKVIVQDDGSDGSKAQTEVQSLVETQHVVAFAANIATYTIPQQRLYLDPHNIPVIGGDCSLPDWNSDPLLFTECASVDTTLFMGMKFGAMFGKSKKLGLLYCAEAAVCAQANTADSDSGMGYAKANGLTIAYSNEFSLTQPDFTQQCLAMQQAGVGIVTVIGDPNAQTRVAASCSRQGFTPQFLAGSALVSPALASTTGFSDMIAEMSTLPFAGLNSQTFQAFQSAFATYDPNDAPGPAGSLGYTSGLLLEKALRIAAAQPGGVISSATIIAAMGTIKNETLGGAAVPLSYTAGKASPDFGCEFLMEVQNGKWVTPQGATPICR